MLVSIKDDTDRDMLMHLIEGSINNYTRFTCKVAPVSRGVFKIYEVRLKERKKYCGSHPYACDIENGRMGRWLEGADWVEFNDRLNDLLDAKHVSANVRSVVCIIRKFRHRRTHYDGELVNPYRNEYQWDKDTDDKHYQYWCDKYAPSSWYPEGTPGTYERI